MNEKTIGYQLSSLITVNYTQAHAIAKVWMAVNPNLFLSMVLIPNLAHQTGCVVQLQARVRPTNTPCRRFAAVSAIKSRLESTTEGELEVVMGHSFLIQPHILKELNATLKSEQMELVECNPYSTRC